MSGKRNAKAVVAVRAVTVCELVQMQRAVGEPTLNLDAKVKRPMPIEFRGLFRGSSLPLMSLIFDHCSGDIWAHLGRLSMHTTQVSLLSLKY